MKKIVFNELFPYEMIRDYFFLKKRKVEKIINTDFKTVTEKDKYMKAENNEKKS